MSIYYDRLTLLLLWEVMIMSRDYVRFITVCLVAALLLLASVGTARAAPPIPPSALWYQVRWGDNLTRIAARYGTTAWLIAEVNGLADPDFIYVGQWLRIPITAPPPPRVHIVRWGETLSGIARLYGTSIWAIARLNGIYNLNRIYVGQRLLIPDP